MIPYFLLLAIPLILSFISTKYRVTVDRRLLFETQSACIDVFMIIFLFLLAFRGLQCGVDTKQYLRMFNQYGSNSITEIFTNYQNEYAFKLLNKLVRTATSNFQVMLIITSVLCVAPLWFFYQHESEDQRLTVALFLSVAPFVMYFSGIKQAIAMSMGIPAWYAAKNKKLILFLLLVILSQQLHASAVVLFVIYPLYHAQITPKWLWFVVPCMALVFFFRQPVFNFLLRFLWEEYSLTDETGATTILMLLIIFAIYSYVLTDENLMDKDTMAMRNILLLSIVIQIFAMLHPLSMRMNYYFLIFVPILIPKIAARSKVQYVQIAKLSKIIMTAYFVYYFINKVIKDIDPLHIFPYIPFWAN